MDHETPGAASFAWADLAIIPVTRATRPTTDTRQPRPMPVFSRRKRRKKKQAVNVGPGKQLIRRTPEAGTPERPEDWRAKAIRAAWAIRDYTALKALGEIDEIPEP
jgi:hypothetical protein